MPVLVGDDLKTAVLWRALYEAGVFVNCVLSPATPPGRALIRTSLMATHTRPQLTRALEAIESVGRRVGLVRPVEV